MPLSQNTIINMNESVTGNPKLNVRGIHDLFFIQNKYFISHAWIFTFLLIFSIDFVPR